MTSHTTHVEKLYTWKTLCKQTDLYYLLTRESGVYVCVCVILCVFVRMIKQKWLKLLSPNLAQG